MQPFHQRFTIHPVGQGLFYSCTINHNNQVKFRMVVDCGSKTAKAGQEEVALYRDNSYMSDKTLDLLVISHFDADHVNCIGKLLQDEIKVKRLVMPFITFEERLFLVARHLSMSNGFKPEYDFAVQFIIDPLGTIANNLDDDSEMYLVDSAPNIPIPPTNNDTRENGEDSNNERFLFDFDRSAKEAIQSGNSIFNSSPIKGKVYRVKDSNKGKLKDGLSIYNLMEFLFYKRAIGNKEGEFFKEIETLFYRKFSVDDSLSIQEKLQATIERVKTIKSATTIKDIFKKAATNVKLITKGQPKVNDLNTTTLCVLHKNLKGIFEFVGFNNNDYRNYCRGYIRRIQKFAPKNSRVETEMINTQEFYWGDPWLLGGGDFYPNVLLTSDAFLLTTDQVDEFLNKYQNYWNDFWLFQIPHHGSEKNSDKLLHSNIPIPSLNFINYGIGNKHAHPSQRVITDLVATGKSSNLIAVNQFSGLVFEFGI